MCDRYYRLFSQQAFFYFLIPSGLQLMLVINLAPFQTPKVEDMPIEYSSVLMRCDVSRMDTV